MNISVHALSPKKPRPRQVTGFAALVLSCLLLLPAAALAATFSASVVQNKAKELSKQPFQPPQPFPEALGKLSQEEWQDITFKKERTIWAKGNLPFKIQLFHPGMLYNTPVTINLVSGGEVQKLPFDVNNFDYGRNHNIIGQMTPQMGYAGFRVMSHLNSDRYSDEVAAFLGATYFRAVAKGQRYGLSARGLALNTGHADGEEFPYFREFWIEHPARKSTTLTIHALLDSKSLTGAYKFVLRPGSPTTMDVTATLFLRTSVAKPGLAPLTSMFLYGENTSPRPIDDYRPEVHDSDGLLIAEDENHWLWRPLENPDTLRITTFAADDPKGFGLIQRDDDFHHYEDLESRFGQRPDLWVTPKGRWGKGHLELIEIPSNKDIHDNIAVFWTPSKAWPVGQPMHYEYTLEWSGRPNQHPPLGYVAATRAMRPARGTQRYVIDFMGKALHLLQPPAKVEAVVTSGPGVSVTDLQVVKNPESGGWRLTFTVRSEAASTPMDFVLPKKIAPVTLRAFLRINDKVLTETWNYAFIPQ